MAREKRRNNEKRKEKSRDAARCRRGKESEIFSDLASCLPLPDGVTQHLDKASIMRLTISLLKIDDVIDVLFTPGQDDDGNTNDSTEKGKQILPDCHLKALEGTVFVLSSDGEIVYLSENVTKYLGLQQIDLMGQPLYDYVHPCDYDDINSSLSKKHTIASPLCSGADKKADFGLAASEDVQTFLIRMKCTLTTKGRSVNLKSAPYKVMKCTGRLVASTTPTSHSNTDDEEEDDVKPAVPNHYMIGLMEPIPHPSNIEIPLDSRTFLSKHEMNMKFIFCDERIERLAGFGHAAMVGQSFFDLHHALDMDIIKKTCKDLFSKGQAMTPPYRMLAAKGGYIWVVTQATTINSSRNQKPQSVVCVHYVLSDVEDQGVILSNIQEDLAKVNKLKQEAPTPPLTPDIQITVKTPETPPTTIMTPDLSPFQMDLLPPKLELSTESIFSPKTKDMDKALCRPADLAPYLTGDPNDLSCLSPTAGEGLVDLPFDGEKDYLLSPLMPVSKSPGLQRRADMMLSPSYSGNEMSRTASPEDILGVMFPLEMDSMAKLFSPLSNTADMNNQDQAPSFQMAELGSPPNLSHQMSPCLADIKMETIDNLSNSDLMDVDFAMRAPYIPMDGEQDLGLLPPSSSTLFNLSKDDINPSVFGRTEYVFGPKQALYEEPKPIPKMSVRDMLGESTVVASIEQPPETNYLKMKRPLDMNCLEKGPPTPAKMSRLGTRMAIVPSSPIQPCRNQGNNKNSVLLNLLLTGEDSSYGYKITHNPNLGISTVSVKPRTSNNLESLTSRDCEVNAPIRSCSLLQGQELLNALDR